MRKEQGFTLIELLIVLAILGVLIGIVAMSMGDLLDTAKERGMKAEGATVQTAIDTWNTMDALETDGEDAVDVGAVDAPAAIEAQNFAKYLRRAPTYTYIYIADTGQLDVCPAGVDGTTYDATVCFVVTVAE